MALWFFCCGATLRGERHRRPGSEAGLGRAGHTKPRRGSSARNKSPMNGTTPPVFALFMLMLMLGWLPGETNNVEHGMWEMCLVWCLSFKHDTLLVVHCGIRSRHTVPDKSLPFVFPPAIVLAIESTRKRLKDIWFHFVPGKASLWAVEWWEAGQAGEFGGVFILFILPDLTQGSWWPGGRACALDRVHPRARVQRQISVWDYNRGVVSQLRSYPVDSTS